MRSIFPRAAGAALLSLCVFSAGADVIQLDTARDPAVDYGSFKPVDPLRLAAPIDGNLIPQPFDPVTITETEPNDAFGTATPIALTGGAGRITGYITNSATDSDFYSITAQAGDRVYAATMTSGSAGTTDSLLDVIASDGTTVLELDNDDGALAGASSVVAGTTLATAGTYYLRVRANGATTQLRPYDLYVQLRSGTPTPEVEPNNNGTPQVLGATRWISGAIDTVATDTDTYALDLNAGDTLFVSTDGDPARDTSDANIRLGVGLFANNFLVVNDAGTLTPDGEAFFVTVRTAGTYQVYLDAPVAPIGDYHLSISVFPAPVRTGACQTYTATLGAAALTDAGTSTFPLVVPDDVRIEDVNVSIDLNHLLPADLDITLQSPAGNEVPLITDVGVAAAPAWNFTLDDEAAIPAGIFAINNNNVFRPEIAGRLEFFDGERSNGTWTLVVRDDTAANTGTINSYALTICAAPEPVVTCPVGSTLTTAYSSDFEADAGGFTHSGTADEWERGLPSFVPITTCNSGANCWKTDLDNTYDVSSTQDLVSPPIDLTGFVAPIYVRWAHRYSMESATFDHYNVTATSVLTTTSVRLFDWTGATMNQAVGVTPPTTVQFSAGWATQFVPISQFAGAVDTTLRFHVDTDDSVNLAGVAIDDVSVVGCRQVTADLGISIDDGLATAQAGTMINYAVLVTSPAGATGTVGAVVSTTVDPVLQNCSYTCTASAGSTCGGGTGNIADTATLLSGGQANYTLICLLPGGATGTLTSNASVSITGGTDPASANNTDSDVDTITPATDGIFQDGFE